MALRHPERHASIGECVQFQRLCVPPQRCDSLGVWLPKIRLPVPEILPWEVF